MILTEFTTEVLEDVPHAPKTVIERNILRAAQDFCQRTRIWEVDLEDVSVVAGTVDYTLVVPAQTDSGTNTLTNILIGLAEVQDEDERDYTGYTYKDGVLTLIEEPTNTFTLTVKGHLKPDFDATYLYDTLYDFYLEGVLAGAKYRLQRMRKKEWENQQASKENRLLFQQQITQCRINKWNEFGSKQLTRRATTLGW